MSSNAPANRLIHETSPYLLQHAHNPVDWFPWGVEALNKAKREDKPILLSIGYAACHWCHVMERESFESERTAALMNEHFVCIKVDREERPDLDDIYMAATVAMSGGGGWPMTVFLTPEQEPFFAGTYFPPEDKYGRPGFPSLLRRVAEAWAKERESLFEQARELTEHIREQSSVGRAMPINLDWAGQAVSQLSQSFDPRHGGFGGAPKFPPSPALRLLTLFHAQTGNQRALEMLHGTLQGMRRGGMYDHIVGGFCRYSTDERWLVPHFEKMLYDNAQLSRVYLEAYQLTGEADYARVARETLDYIARDMQDVEGGYFSATDADSEGEEGKFFVWTPPQVASACEALDLPNGAVAAFCAYYDISNAGNWEGHSIPNTPRALSDVAADFPIGGEELLQTFELIREAMHNARVKRPQPLLDDKILVSWNGLMLGSMAEGYRVLGDSKYLESATRAANFLLQNLRRPDGGLFRTARRAKGELKAHLDAYLEDYAFLADGLIDLVEAGAPIEFLSKARELCERMLEDFGDEDGALFNTARQHEALLVRSREGHDGAIPNANAVAARALARLAKHLGDSALEERAVGALSAYASLMQRQPRSFATSLHAASFLAAAPIELCFSGSLEASEALRRRAARCYLPARVIAHARPGEATTPLTEGKQSPDPALFICRNFACQRPITDAAQVESAIAAALAEAKQLGQARVTGKRLPGQADAAATTAYAKSHASLQFSTWTFSKAAPSSELRVSRLGFGGYRVDQGHPGHRMALLRALQSGINLIDTSTNYTGGQSEELVGSALSELHAQGVVKREAVVVVSKVGYVQGPNLDKAKQRIQQGKPYPDMVEYSDDCWHCLHPEWIEDQLTDSLARLGLETLDVYLLHNPEYFLSHAAETGRAQTPDQLSETREAFYARVTQAFEQLEREVRRGRIAAYGVSSNTLVREADHPEATNLGRLLECAEKAAQNVLKRTSNHFRVIQLPFNLVEAGAALTLNHQGASGAESVLSAAQHAGLEVLVNRPLNAITDGGLLRLAEPPAQILEENTVALPAAQSRVAGLEQEYRRNFAPDLRAPKGSPLKPESFFNWAELLGVLHGNTLDESKIGSLIAWHDLEQRVIARETGRYLSALDNAFAGQRGEAWREWRGRYVRALDEYISALRQQAAAASARSLKPVVEALARAGAPRRPVSQLALGTLLATAGVTSVLVGMRQEEYVDDALESARQPLNIDAQSLLKLTNGVR
ncbi:MAG: aldo/keto reductase [Polyangiaceae bacterium]